MGRKCDDCVHRYKAGCTLWECNHETENDLYNRGYADGSLSVTTEIKNKVIKEYRSKVFRRLKMHEPLTYETLFEAMQGAMDD